jgi:hypothetical protein
MTKDELWKIYVEKNPQFADPAARFTMTGAGLKKLFDQTWERAHDKGVANGKALASKDEPAGSAFDQFMRSFNSAKS